MKLLLAVTLCALPVFGDQFGYDIKDILDEALENFAAAVTKGGDDSVDVEEPIGVAGFVMYGAKLKDMSTLRRTGPALLVPLDEEVEVRANLTLGKLYLDGEKIEGPWKSFDKARIMVRENSIAIKFRAHLEATSYFHTSEGENLVTKTCFAAYSASVERLSSVVLVTREGVTPLDQWVDGLFLQITSFLNPLLSAVFEKYLDLCESLRAKGYRLMKTGGSF